jgi:O-antigen/teichoic acid export membrane protein
VLALFLSPAALGLYVVGLAFTNLPYFIAKSVGLITFPWVASRPEEADARRMMWSLFWLTTGIAVVLVAILCALAHWLVPFFFGRQFDAAVTVTYIVLPGTVFLSARRVLSEGLKGRGYPLAGTLGELLALAWVAVALAVFVPLWGIYGAAAALASSYVVSLVMLVGLAGRHGELESASRSLLSLPHDSIRAIKGSGLPAEVAFQEPDRPARVS